MSRTPARSCTAISPLWNFIGFLRRRRRDAMVRLHQQLDEAGRPVFAVAEIAHLAEPRIVIVVGVVGTDPMTAGSAVKRDRVVLPRRKIAGHRVAARSERARVDDVKPSCAASGEYCMK